MSQELQLCGAVSRDGKKELISRRKCSVGVLLGGVLVRTILTCLHVHPAVRAFRFLLLSPIYAKTTHSHSTNANFPFTGKHRKLTRCSGSTKEINNCHTLITKARAHVTSFLTSLFTRQ